MSTTTTLLTLPFLALVSLPLVITASITIFFSAIALSLQVSIISIELCYALITNLFTIPSSPNWSLLSFSVSGPNTPSRRRSSDYGFLHTPLIFLGQDQSQVPIQGRPGLGPRMGSSNPFLDSPEQESSSSPYQLFETRYSRSHSQPRLHRSTGNLHHKRNLSGFQGLINGDENRDFEGLGGWRCPPSYTKSPGYRSGRTTPSSTNSISDEIDDIAWVSINSRLELPSQPPILRHGSSNHNLPYAYNECVAEPHLPRRKSSRIGLSTMAMASDPKRVGSKGNGNGHRHHRRSATTSALFGSGLCNPPSTHVQGSCRTPSTTRNGQTAMQSRGDDLRSKSNTSLSEQWGVNQNAASRESSVCSRGSGYFGLQPMISDTGTGGAKTTGHTTPKEERKPARIPGLLNRFLV
ncbi:hypothetical protein BDV18DRAFT_1729 [Aspergillus unguis]